MKLTHLLFVLAIFSFAACGDDDGTSGNLDTLSYDGDNASAPELAPGIHQLAVRFPASYLTDAVGKKLNEVEAFLAPGAVSYKLLVRDRGTSSSPGAVLFEKDITANVDVQKWVITKVDPPLEITGEDLWIAVEVDHDATAQTIGCDSGPRKEGGDWIWDSIGQNWETFLGRTGTESVNWNIRGHLQD